MWMELAPSSSLRKLTVLAAGLGVLIVGGVSSASAEANCPGWSTPVCRAWNMGPPPSCREWACAADKKSDPPKTATMGSAYPGGVRHPIVRPPVVTTGGVYSGTGTTTTIYATHSFGGGHGRR